MLEKNWKKTEQRNIENDGLWNKNGRNETATWRQGKLIKSKIGSYWEWVLKKKIRKCW